MNLKVKFAIEFYNGRYYIGDNDVTGFMEQSDKNIVGENLEVNADCDVFYQPYERRTLEYPGHEASLTIERVFFEEKFSSLFGDYLDDYVKCQYEDELLEQYEKYIEESSIEDDFQY